MSHSLPNWETLYEDFDVEKLAPLCDFYEDSSIPVAYRIRLAPSTCFQLAVLLPVWDNETQLVKNPTGPPHGVV